MLNVKPKGIKQFKLYGNKSSIKMRAANDDTAHVNENNFCLKDYFDEIFSGLSWLG